MKAVILAGGSGTRLYPTTKLINKHFLPIYNKPMIYYPISLVMLLKIRDIVFVINPEDEPMFLKLFEVLQRLGLNVSYVFQEKPNGLAEGLILTEDFIKDSNVMYLLGDNLLYGHNVWKELDQAKREVEEGKTGAYTFGYYVKDPHRFGIVEFDEKGRVISIEEKPKRPKSHFAVIGIYFFDKKVVEFAKRVKPSERGELEITSVLQEYINIGELKVKILGRGFAWFDAGTYDSFLEASHFVSTIENKTGLMIGCLEEIAYRNGWISKEELLELAKPLSKTDYGRYLIKLVEEEHAL